MDDAKEIAKQIEKARASQSKDVGKAMNLVGEKLLSLDKRILTLSQKLEQVAQMILKNGENLRDKEKLTPELKSKFHTQGSKFENIGGKIKNIAINFGVIGDRMVSIGSRVSGSDGPKIKNYGTQLKDLADNITPKGGSVEQLGIKIQELEHNVRDAGTDKDLEDMLHALGEIGNELKAILKVHLFCYIYFLIIRKLKF